MLNMMILFETVVNVQTKIPRKSLYKNVYSLYKKYILLIFLICFFILKFSTGSRSADNRCFPFSKTGSGGFLSGNFAL